MLNTRRTSTVGDGRMRHECENSMGPRRTSTGAYEVPDFKDVPELTQIERDLIVSYVGFVKAGVAVSPECLLDESDWDSCWASDTIFRYKLARLDKLCDSASDPLLRRVLEARRTCLHDAFIRKRQGPTKVAGPPAFMIRGTKVWQNLPQHVKETPVVNRRPGKDMSKVGEAQEQAGQGDGTSSFGISGPDYDRGWGRTSVPSGDDHSRPVEEEAVALPGSDTHPSLGWVPDTPDTLTAVPDSPVMSIGGSGDDQARPCFTSV